MKKKNIIILALLVLAFSLMTINNANAQIFLMEEEEEFNDRLGGTLGPGGIFIPLMPDHDTTWDYTPIGDGLWLLGCLGGAYLLGKRRKREED